MLLTVWLATMQRVLVRGVFVTWTALLTYLNGPYYALLELCRNLQIFGFRKLNIEDEFGQCLEGKVCVITGGTRGIGLGVVRFLMSKQCTVITGTSSLGENPSEAMVEAQRRQLLKDIMDSPMLEGHGWDEANKQLRLLPLNLASMQSVAAFANKIDKLVDHVDYLICNGGVMFVPYKLSKDNFEQHNAINYYSHALLTLKLLPKLAKAKTGNSRGRIVIVSSGSHHASWGLRLEDFNSNELYSIYHAYAQSKLALIMFTYTFDRMLRQATLADGSNLGDSVSINCLHPGICRTSLMNSFTFFKFKPIQESLLFRSAKDGAETILYLTLSHQVETIDGKYFENLSVAKSSDKSYDKVAQQKLWVDTWRALGNWLSDQEVQLVESISKNKTYQK